MNKPVSASDLVTPKVTTGPLIGSRKAHVVPTAAPDLRVPIREIVLTKESGEEPLPVYDTSGPYTDNDVVIDVEKGLKRSRIEWVKERGGVEEYDGRPIKPVDNGNVSGKHLARAFPNTPKPMRAQDGKPVTQLEWARAGVITKEMIYIAARENLGRKQQLERAEAAGARVIVETRRGYGSAYLAGFTAARGRYIVMADADLTYDFAEIPRFVEHLEAGADLAHRDVQRAGCMAGVPLVLLAHVQQDGALRQHRGHVGDLHTWNSHAPDVPMPEVALA